MHFNTAASFFKIERLFPTHNGHPTFQKADLQRKNEGLSVFAQSLTIAGLGIAIKRVLPIFVIELPPARMQSYASFLFFPSGIAGEMEDDPRLHVNSHHKNSVYADLPD